MTLHNVVEYLKNRVSVPVGQKKWFEPFLMAEIVLEILLLISSGLCHYHRCYRDPLVQGVPFAFIIVNGLLLSIHWFSWGIPMQSRFYKSIIGVVIWLIFFFLWVSFFAPFDGIYVFTFILSIFSIYESNYWHKKIKNEHSSTPEQDMK